MGTTRSLLHCAIPAHTDGTAWRARLSHRWAILPAPLSLAIFSCPSEPILQGDRRETLWLRGLVFALWRVLGSDHLCSTVGTAWPQFPLSSLAHSSIIATVFCLLFFPNWKDCNDSTKKTTGGSNKERPNSPYTRGTVPIGDYSWQLLLQERSSMPCLGKRSKDEVQRGISAHSSIPAHSLAGCSLNTNSRPIQQLFSYL